MPWEFGGKGPLSTEKELIKAVEIQHYITLAKGPQFLNGPVGKDIEDLISNNDLVAIKAKLTTALAAKVPPVSIDVLDKAVEERKKEYPCTGYVLNDTGKKFLDKYNSNNAALAMAINMGNILEFQNINPSTQTVEGMAINVLFQLVMYLIYAASFISLGAVLMVRLVVIWITLVMSPLLMMVVSVPPLKEKMGDIGKLWDTFLTHAMAPLIIALFMSIGWIMMKGVQSISGDAFAGVGKGFGVGGLNTLQDLIVAIGVVVIVWTGVFAAAKDTFAKSITGAISGALKLAGRSVAMLPLKHTPLVPTQTESAKNPSIFTMGMALKQFARGVENEDAKKSANLARAITGDTNMTTGELKGLQTADEARKALGVKSRLEKIAGGDTSIHANLTASQGFIQLTNTTTGQFRDLLARYQKANEEGEIQAEGKALRDYIYANQNTKGSGVPTIHENDVDPVAGAKPPTTTDTTTQTTTGNIKIDSKSAATLTKTLGEPEGAAKTVSPENAQKLKDFVIKNNINLEDLDTKDKATSKTLVDIYDKFIGKIPSTTDEKLLKRKAEEAKDFLNQTNNS